MLPLIRVHISRSYLICSFGFIHNMFYLNINRSSTDIRSMASTSNFISTWTNENVPNLAVAWVRYISLSLPVLALYIVPTALLAAFCVAVHLLI